MFLFFFVCKIYLYKDYLHKNIICWICRCKQPGNLKIHMNLKHNPMAPIFKCDFCPYLTKLKPNLKAHYINKHSHLINNWVPTWLLKNRIIIGWFFNNLVSVCDFLMLSFAYWKINLLIWLEINLFYCTNEIMIVPNSYHFFKNKFYSLFFKIVL